MALYDALAFQNRWIDYNASQYKGAHSLLTTLLHSQLSKKDVELAILALEDLGFDTLPFGVDFNAGINFDGDED